MGEKQDDTESLPAWGVRVEIRPGCPRIRAPASLPAWGVRVEISPSKTRRCSMRSLPAWGVRVEIRPGCPRIRAPARHSPHGECGLKYDHALLQPDVFGHSPHGECGLKYLLPLTRDIIAMSLPAWGVRVEIGKSDSSGSYDNSHSPHGECGLKYVCSKVDARVFLSLPAWGVRVEIGRLKYR